MIGLVLVLTSTSSARERDGTFGCYRPEETCVADICSIIFHSPNELTSVISPSTVTQRYLFREATSDVMDAGNLIQRKRSPD